MILLRTAAKFLISTAVLSGVTAFALATEPEAVPGQILIKLKPNVVTSFGLSTLSTKFGINYLRTIPKTEVLVFEKKNVVSNMALAKQIAASPEVEFAEPNYIYRISKVPNDPLLTKLWGLSNDGSKDSKGQVGVAGVDIGAVKAWDIETGSRDVVVAVIDTGINYLHPDLKDNVWTNEAEAKGLPLVDDDKNGFVDDIHGYNFSADGTGKGDAMDDHGHGSHCSGTIGAKGDDGAGIVGVNWNVRIMGVKFLTAEGSGSLENAIKAINYAAQMGAKIMSNSWGGGGYSELLEKAIKDANDKNILFVAAAGNDGSNNDATPSYPASYQVPNVLSVAAIDNRGTLAGFSNYGKKTVHVGAPGVNVYSSILGEKYDAWSGTSMATPHVSGISALILAHEPNLTAIEMKERIIKTAVPFAALKGRMFTSSVVNAFNALTNEQAPPDPNDPGLWTNTVELNYSTPHPYASSSQVNFEVNVPSATKLALYFEKFHTENGYDRVTLFDRDGKKLAEYSGTSGDGWTPSFDVNYIKVVLKSDSSVNEYGFDLVKAAYK